MRAGISSATDVSALSPSPTVMTLICSRCNVICTILRTVGLSSTTNTVGSVAIFRLTSFASLATRNLPYSLEVAANSVRHLMTQSQDSDSDAFVHYGAHDKSG